MKKLQTKYWLKPCLSQVNHYIKALGMKPVHLPVNRTAPQRCQLPYAALRAAQPFTTVHFSNDQGPEIRSSFPLQEDSSSSEVGEAMPCATCQNRSSPCLCMFKGIFQQHQCHHFHASLCWHGSFLVFPYSPQSS